MKKKLIILPVILGITLSLSAQTNIFPSSGNVGIGSNSPKAKLEVDGGILGNTIGSILNITTIKGNTRNDSKINFLHKRYEGGNDWVGVGTRIQMETDITPQGYLEFNSKPYNIRDGRTRGAVSFGYDNTEFFRVNFNGNLGIGTNNPKAKLDVEGTTRLGGITVIKGPFLEFQGTDIQLGTSNGRSVGNKPLQRALVHEQGDLLVVNYDGDFEGGILMQGPKIRIEGNVGIGTNNPKAKLEVDGGILGNTIGSILNITTIKGNTGNDSKINFLHKRYEGGNDWVGVGTRIQMVTDITPQGYLEFNSKPYNIRDGRTRGAVSFGYDNTEFFRVNFNGNLGIGTNNPDEKLTVNGTIHSKEVKVDLQIPADYVFQKYYTGNSTLKNDYEMPTLEEVEKFTKENHHLPGMPSAGKIQENGMKLGEMNNLLLQKVEELTLYIIEQKKVIEMQEKRLNKLENKLN